MRQRHDLDRVATGMIRRANLAEWISPYDLAKRLGHSIEPANDADLYADHARVMTALARAELEALCLPADDQSSHDLAAKVIACVARRIFLRAARASADSALDDATPPGKLVRLPSSRS